jgi:urease accessory protein
MRIKTSLRSLGGVLALALATSAAQAHPGHGTEGLAAGLAHPFMGIDHLLAMVAVGLWSVAALPPGRRALGPAVFLAMLLTGAVLAHGGLMLPSVEAGVAASVLMLGVLMLGARRVPVPLGLALVAMAALLHGQAHGSELLAGQSFAAYATGFMAGSALLHGLGLGAGAWIQRARAGLWRGVAALIGASGLLMLAARV